LPLTSNAFDFIVLIVPFFSGLQNYALNYGTFFILFFFGPVVFRSSSPQVSTVYVPPSLWHQISHPSRAAQRKVWLLRKVSITIFCMTPVSFILQ
jgi:hypothetical protein